MLSETKQKFLKLEGSLARTYGEKMESCKYTEEAAEERTWWIIGWRGEDQQIKEINELKLSFSNTMSKTF